MLCPAGFSSGTGVGTRGGWAAGRCVPVAATRIASPERGGVAVGDGGVSLRVAFCARSRLLCVPVGMSCVRSRLPYVSIGRFCVRSRLSLFLCQEKRDGLRYVAFLFRRGSGSPLACSRRTYGYRAWLVHFGPVRLFAAIPTKYWETRRTESAARQSAFLRNPIGLAAFSAGNTLGAARPQTCAKEPLALWTLFF